MQVIQREPVKKLTSSRIRRRINTFIKGRKDINSRYSSFDLCYLYFSNNKSKLAGNNLHQSCLQLWSFLGSWGMITRGNALQKQSYAFLKEVITLINDNPQFYKVDIDKSNYALNILDLYKKIKMSLKLNQKNQKTLITKIILGVYGICPAFDTYFCKTFKCSTLGDLTMNDLDKIVSFYFDNKQTINTLCKEIRVLKFNGSESTKHYPKAKIIDMIGFTR